MAPQKLMSQVTVLLKQSFRGASSYLFIGLQKEPSIYARLRLFTINRPMICLPFHCLRQALK